jgi:hypothetical protein
MKTRYAFPLVAALMVIAASGGAVIAQTTESVPATSIPGNSMTPQPTTPSTPETRRPGGARFAAVQQACGADFQALCPGLTPGDGKLGACIRENRAKLSPGCTTALQSLRGMQQQRQRQEQQQQ